jgi:hypothetical protein
LLAKRRPDLVVPKAAWGKPWVVHATAGGEGEEDVLRNLAHYVFRVAITNSRIVSLDDNGVTIRHKHRNSKSVLVATLALHQQGLDTRTPAGMAKFQMLGVFAEFELAMIQERLRAGLARARGEGKRLGRPGDPWRRQRRLPYALR